MIDELEPTAARLLDAVVAAGQTVATAESLTGGLIGDRLTAVPGASRAYRGGLITYASDLKVTLAGVRTQTLRDHGAVSEETAIEMALGAARRCGADWGIAATGVAGPDGQEGHPAGTVFVAVARLNPAGDQARVERLSLAGSRTEIRQAAALGALALAERAIGNV